MSVEKAKKMLRHMISLRSNPADKNNYLIGISIQESTEVLDELEKQPEARNTCPSYMDNNECAEAKDYADLEAKLAELNIILYHRENGLSHPDLQGEIDKSKLIELEAKLKDVENKYETLSDTVQISCDPPDDCNDPVVLKINMKGCLDALKDAEAKNEKLTSERNELYVLNEAPKNLPSKCGRCGKKIDYSGAGHSDLP